VSADSEAIRCELDYLWDTVRGAQDAEASAAAARAEAGEALARATARIALLEKELARAAERENGLKAGAARLKTALDENSSALEAAAAQAAPRAELETAVRAGNARSAALETEIARLRAEAAGMREALKGRGDAIELLNAKVAALLAMPEIAAALAADGAASGKSAPVYEHLIARLEKDKLETARLGLELEKAAADAAAAREKAAEAEAGGLKLQNDLAAATAQLETLRTAAHEAELKARLSAEEKAAIDGRALALNTALEERGTALAAARAENAALARSLDEAAAETARLREAAAQQAARTEEQRANFAAATAQVFRLQELAAGLRAELAAANDKNKELSAGLEGRLADIEKVNGLLLEARNGLAMEKETSRRAAIKVKSLAAEIEELKHKISESGEYSGKLLRGIEERDRLNGALKEELKKLPALELQNEDLRRRNIKFSGLLQREQSDFTSRAVSGLEKAAKDLRGFSLRIPAAERKALDPALKSVLASINLMKGWQEYMDPETPQLTAMDLGPFVSGEAGKWERAFKQRKLAIAVGIATPRLRAPVDEERLKMVFYNLIKNAYECLPSGGSLRITLKASEDERSAVILFEDNGPGFAKETLDKLYAPFNTTGKGKAGIGLAVCRRIAEKHGGTLEVSNKKDRGALVELRLPLGN
jgi:signal transduction histidine kinase